MAKKSKKQRKKNKQKAPKERNWVAVGAIQRKGGAMTDRKKEKSKRACRKTGNKKESSHE